MLVYSRVPEVPETNGAAVPQAEPRQAKADSKARLKAEAGITLPDHIQTMVDVMNSSVKDQVELNELAKVGVVLVSEEIAGVLDCAALGSD